jgi:hypothetical protein
MQIPLPATAAAAAPAKAAAPVALAEPAPVMATRASAAPRQAAVETVPAAVALGGDEIDSMMGEVQPDLSMDSLAAPVDVAMAEEPVEELSVAIDDPARSRAAGFEIDHAADPDFGRPAAALGAQPQITLTEVAGDDDLFNDPSLAVARMAPGDTREILVPVELADPKRGVKRLKLSVRIRLDSAD